MALIPISLSISLLAGVYTYMAMAYGILVWPAFIGWAIFFFAGGSKEALVKALPPMISGLVLGYLSIITFKWFSGGIFSLALLVAIIAFIMTIMMNLPAFALAPAAFASCAAFFGAGDLLKSGLPLLLGLFLGYISVSIPALLKKEN